LAQELRLQALPDLYGAVAQSAAKRKDASYADFLEEVLKGEPDARRVRAREMLTRIAGFPALKTLEAYDFAYRQRRTAPADPGARRPGLRRTQ
jgi:DNA replication protein DnaC